MSGTRMPRPVRLCVTDLDGCLLDAESHIPDGFDDTLAFCSRQGMTVCAASGRSVEGMKEAVGPLADRMALISDNGARVWVHGVERYCRTIPCEVWKPVAREAGRHPGLHLVMTLRDGAVLDGGSSLSGKETAELLKYYPEWKTASVLSMGVDAVKLSLLYFGDIEKEIYPFFDRFNASGLSVRCTARTWIDVNLAEVDKSDGVRELQRLLDVSKEETAVFGDYLNDLSMADYAAWAFAPSNAHPEVQRKFNRHIGHHADGSVSKAILTLAGGFLPEENV